MKDFMISTSGCDETLLALTVLHAEGWGMDVEEECRKTRIYSGNHGNPPLFIWLNPERKALQGVCWGTRDGREVYPWETYMYSIAHYNDY